MQLHGIPNDIMTNFNPLTVIVFIPVCDKVVYPALRQIGIRFKPITRIFWGFMLGAAAMIYAAGVQHAIYGSPPCYNAPRRCEAGLQTDGNYEPNRISVLVQIPAYLLIGLSEILASVTGLEYAYTKAAPDLKSVVMSLFLLTNAIGAALAGALAPTAKDPYLVGSSAIMRNVMSKLMMTDLDVYRIGCFLLRRGFVVLEDLQSAEQV